MKGIRAIRFRQWLTITLSYGLAAIFFTLYDYSNFHTLLIEKISLGFSFRNYLLLNLGSSLVAGMFISALLVYFLQDRFREKSYGYSILMLLAIMIVMMFLFSIPYYMIMSAQLTGKPVTSPETMALIRKQLFGQIDAGWYILIMLVVLQQFGLQVSNKFGPGALWKMVKGTYNKPKIENRIFMFADLNDSTTVAERLSDERYHQFLRNYFGNITYSILDYGGEIYQYLGDGIIIVWKYYGDERDLQCIDCFFDMKKEIEKKRQQYEKKYGVVPTFKAGIHGGKVVVGEIGIIKRDISYSGDVVNTASRIQSMCKELKSELLISNELLRSFPPVSMYETRSVGSIQLKGKVKEVELSSVGLK
jgi:adenylate cyclase